MNESRQNPHFQNTESSIKLERHSILVVELGVNGDVQSQNTGWRIPPEGSRQGQPELSPLIISVKLNRVRPEVSDRQRAAA